MFVTVVFFVFRALLRWRRAEGSSVRALVPSGLAFALGLAGGAALAALVLGPFIEFVLHSGDLARRQHSVAGYGRANTSGPCSCTILGSADTGRPRGVHAGGGWYAGAATLMLALGALLLRRTAERIAVLVFAFCVMVIGLPPVFHLVSRCRVSVRLTTSDS